MTGRRYRAAGPADLREPPTLHKAFQPTLEVRCGYLSETQQFHRSVRRLHFAARSPRPLPDLLLCRLHGDCHDPPPLNRALQVLRQLKHGIAPIASVSRHIIQNRAINMMRLGVYGAIPTRTKRSLPVRHKLVSHRIFREQVADAAAVRNLLNQRHHRFQKQPYGTSQ